MMPSESAPRSNMPLAAMSDVRPMHDEMQGEGANDLLATSPAFILTFRVVVYPELACSQWQVKRASFVLSSAKLCPARDRHGDAALAPGQMARATPAPSQGHVGCLS